MDAMAKIEANAHPVVPMVVVLLLFVMVVMQTHLAYFHVRNCSEDIAVDQLDKHECVNALFCKFSKLKGNLK